MSADVKEIQFRVEQNLLRGHLHTAQAEGRRPGILLVPGFADISVGPHNLHIWIARALTQAGFAVLRFDYRGLGESEGDFRNFTAQSGLQDVRAALICLQEQPEVNPLSLGIVGYSLGGTLASILAAEQPAVKTAVLLAPVAYPEQVFRTFFTPEHLEQGEQQGWIDWLGWPVGRDYLPSLKTLEPLHAMEKVRIPMLVLHGTEDGEVPLENGLAYAERGATLQRLQGVDHQFASVIVQNQVIESTREWFKSNGPFSPTTAPY